jgi:cyclic pyranopterin phosphate synthase
MDSSSRLTHIDPDGRPRMVDVSEKPATSRVARAEAHVALRPATVELLRAGAGPKGDALSVARLAGILAAKRTPDLIPLCHPIRLDAVEVDLALVEDGVQIVAETRARDVTGVEMEAMTAAAVAALTVYDMVKAVDRGARVTNVRVMYKTGGQSGEWSCGEGGGG